MRVSSLNEGSIPTGRGSRNPALSIKMLIYSIFHAKLFGRFIKKTLRSLKRKFKR